MSKTVQQPTAATSGPATRTPLRTPKAYAVLLLKGITMGSADVIPGVSGGTMAFILGIYEELIESLRTLGQPRFLRALVRFRFKEALELVNWRFLLTLVSGIAVALLSLARVLEWLLANRPVLIWSFFFGLISASVITVSQRVARWHLPTFAAFLFGCVGAFILVGLSPAETPTGFGFLFISGALAICAMILPGISGAFILVLLGKYEFALSALNRGDVLSLASLALGALVGLISFAQVLGWLFRRYHDLTVALLCGFMLGSLRKVWPWKAAATSDSSQVITNVLPPLNVGGAFNLDILYALLLAALGFVIVLAIEYVGRHGNGSVQEQA